jgi:hypothetical protein
MDRLPRGIRLLIEYTALAAAVLFVASLIH